MTVQTQELYDLLQRLAAYLQQLDVPEIELSDDYYWEIDPDDRNSMYTQPGPLSVGQLSEDWALLQESVRSDSVTLHDLVKLAAILRAIGEAGEAHLLTQQTPALSLNG